MRVIIDPKAQVYMLDKNNPPEAFIDSGDTVVFTTEDCYSGVLDDESKTTATHFQNMKLNPVNGPAYVNGAMPGDTLKVTIEDIEIISEYGTMVVDEGDVFFFNHRLNGCYTKRIKMEDGYADIFGNKIPLDPMLGVLGVAPADEAVPPMYQGNYGGNMDCKLLRKGTVVYLPVLVEGGLLATGDAHSLQGDGEIVCGLEIPARVTLKVELIKGRAEKWPILETKDRWYSVACTNPIQECAKEALNGMLDFLAKRNDSYDIYKWIVLMCFCGDLEFNEVVGHVSSVRFGFDKSIAGNIEF